MILAKVSGFTRVCGVEQGYQPLYIRDETVKPDNLGFEVNAMISMWVPTEEERTRILAGEPVFMRALGTTPAPVILGVGDPAVYGW